MELLMQINQVMETQFPQPLKQQIIQALFVNKIFWNGAFVHAGHYPNGLIITNGLGQQYAYENGILVGISNLWNYETINRIQYVKHIYPNGSCVYSTEFSQFVVIP